MNKLAIIRYQALDRCFRNKYKRFYIEDLIDACNDALYDFMGEGHEVKRRQIFDDIRFMESPEGWNIPLERIPDGRRVYYRYQSSFSINERPLSDAEMDTLVQAVSTLSRFRGLPQFEWMESLLANLQDKFFLKGNDGYVIGFEQNIDYLAAEHLSTLFNMIVNRQVIHIDYRTFAGRNLEWDIHPYFLKEYNNRWFLMGLNNDYPDGLVTIPLDRIVSISPVTLSYRENKDIDFNVYFDDVVGVTLPKGKSCENIKLRFDLDYFPYIESKPFHGSMKIVDRESGIVTVDLIPNNEFMSLLFSFRDQVEVLSPEWLREAVKDHILAMYSKYFTCADVAHR